MVSSKGQKERNEVLRLFDMMKKHNYGSGFNSGNSLTHETEKLTFWYVHKGMKHMVLLEPYLKNGHRPDAACLDCRLLLEVVVSERDESLIRKKNFYPELDVQVTRAEFR